MVVYNKLIPFKGFYAINLFSVIFIRSEYRGYFKADKIAFNNILNHEKIHTRQQLELLFIFFYLIYLVEWIAGLFKYCNSRMAYSNISFEREAKKHERDWSYLLDRKLFSMWRK